MKTNQHTTNCTKVGSFKPHQTPSIVTYDTTTWSDMDYAANTAWRMYNYTIKVYRDRIDNTLRHLYGDKKIQFDNSYITEMISNIKEIYRISGRTCMSDVVRDFRSYMGYPVKFFRNDHGKQVPVESSRVIEAYKAMKDRQIIKRIEKILYF